MRCEKELDGVILENSDPVLVLLLIRASSFSVEEISFLAKVNLHSMMGWDDKMINWESLFASMKQTQYG
jgi:hypothetical protein